MSSAGRSIPAVYLGSVGVAGGTARVVALRNERSAPVTVDRLDAPPDCSAILLGAGPLPVTIPPAGSALLQITVKPTGMPDGPAALAACSSRQIKVFVRGDAVHAAAVLEVTGRLFNGAAFEPDVLDLGRVDAGHGARKRITVVWEQGALPAAPARLSASPELPVSIVPAPAGAGARAAGSGLARAAYYVTLPPRSTAGPLSGAITFAGPGSRTYSLPVVGEVVGSVSARPSSVVFGAVGKQTAAGPEAEARRTRWVWLVRRPATDAAAAGPKQRRPVATPTSLWRGARVSATPACVSAALVLDSPPATPSVAGAPPPPSPAGITPGSACRLRVMLATDAPAGQVEGWVTVTFANGERLRLPVTATVE
jgi:hypothetical protein